MIETSGERPLANVPVEVHKIVDVKCPGSGEGGSFRMDNLAALTKRDEVKFVISDRADYEFAREFVREHGLDAKVGSVLFSPAFTKTPSPIRTAENCHPRSSTIGRVDARRRARSAAKPPNPQVHLGTGDEGRLGPRFPLRASCHPDDQRAGNDPYLDCLLL